MKLTTNQKRVLGGILLQANKSDVEIGKMLGIPNRTVRQCIDFLTDNGIVKRRTIYVDLPSLGMQQYLIHISLPPKTLTHRDKLVKLLGAADQVSVVAELGGEDQIEIRVCAKGLPRIQRFLEVVAEKFPFPFYVRNTLLIAQQEYSGLAGKNLNLTPQPLLGFSTANTKKAPFFLDEKDHHILSALANGTYRNMQQVAREVSIGATSLAYRIQTLEKASVIVGYFYLMDIKLIDEHPLYLLVKCRALTEGDRKRLTEFCRRHTRIAWISFFVGGYSAEIFLSAASYEEANQVINNLATSFDDLFESIKVVPQMDFSKYSYYPFKNYQALLAA
jgi:DNA-binding Lrp family transcriptional regulator